MEGFEHDKIENWVPAKWMMLNSGMTNMDAREKILQYGISISDGVNQAQLAKLLGI